MFEAVASGVTVGWTVGPVGSAVGATGSGFIYVLPSADV